MQSSATDAENAEMQEFSPEVAPELHKFKLKSRNQTSRHNLPDLKFENSLQEKLCTLTKILYIERKMCLVP
ncbi:uncharacterized protein PHALS_06203 [Plasmopara halstedii]|uniref:Uncharacterized protein n=1 Tax=Plasmopara halstedii TaxID=4781 RepID=A0A0P1B125_PLAHL|nr:uncharacterized protein PHALS_06203 [Plasmopara halstedii]CEG48378.1 hypothetical protein PHALS_06203 [Plasmopara halstedii]|eukprot:XP_024584747.1 hypothetical protein PHALS_06203 [Plasmopara halstedii]